MTMRPTDRNDAGVCNGPRRATWLASTCRRKHPEAPDLVLEATMGHPLSDVGTAVDRILALCEKQTR